MPGAGINERHHTGISIPASVGGPTASQWPDSPSQCHRRRRWTPGRTHALECVGHAAHQPAGGGHLRAGDHLQSTLFAGDPVQRKDVSHPRWPRSRQQSPWAASRSSRSCALADARGGGARPLQRRPLLPDDHPHLKGPRQPRRWPPMPVRTPRPGDSIGKTTWAPERAGRPIARASHV